MNTAEKDKELITQAVNHISKELIGLSHKIHNNPEMGFNEFKASKWLTEFLKSRGFKIKQGVCRSEERRVGKECRSRWSPYH